MINKQRIMISLFVTNLLFLSGCSDETVWKESVPFSSEGRELYGTEGKFGIIKVNGNTDEPAFPVDQGRHYTLFFLDEPEELNGKKYKMSATHQETEETIKLYEWGIEDNQSGAKFSLNKEGLWKINISIDGSPYTSFIVEAEKE